MYENPIEAIAQVVELRDERLCYVTLPNGKRILAHLAKDFSADLTQVNLGSKVRLEMTTFDFEKGRIVEITPTAERPL